ncbi:unnamed protein product, partial [marine sediment metagenome]
CGVGGALTASTAGLPAGTHGVELLSSKLVVGGNFIANNAGSEGLRIASVSHVKINGTMTTNLNGALGVRAEDSSVLDVTFNMTSNTNTDEGFIVQDNSRVNGSSNCTASGNTSGSGILVRSGSSFRIGGTTTASSNVGGGGSNGIRVEDGCTGTFGVIVANSNSGSNILVSGTSQVRFTNLVTTNGSTGGSGIEVEKLSVVSVNTNIISQDNFVDGIRLSTCATFQSTGTIMSAVLMPNGAFGINIRSGSRMCNNGSGNTNNITGGSGDVRVGTAGTKSWVNIQSMTPAN